MAISRSGAGTCKDQDVYGKPSRKYLHVMAKLGNAERKLIKTLQAAEHPITTKNVRDHALIAIEDTAIANMTKSAKGTLENPGRNVAQNAGSSTSRPRTVPTAWKATRRSERIAPLTFSTAAVPLLFATDLFLDNDRLTPSLEMKVSHEAIFWAILDALRGD